MGICIMEGNNITRRNLLQIHTNDIRYNEVGYRPLSKLCDCSEGEREYLMQSLDAQLHRGDRGLLLSMDRSLLIKKRNEK